MEVAEQKSEISQNRHDCCCKWAEQWETYRNKEPDQNRQQDTEAESCSNNIAEYNETD